MVLGLEPRGSTEPHGGYRQQVIRGALVLEHHRPLCLQLVCHGLQGEVQAPGQHEMERGGEVGTRPWVWFGCLWRRLLASHHCTFRPPVGGGGGRRLEEGHEPTWRPRGGGGLGTCDIWNGEIWCGEMLVPILKYRCEIWYRIPRWWHKNQDTPRRWASGCLLSFPGGCASPERCASPKR